MLTALLIFVALGAVAQWLTLRELLYMRRHRQEIADLIDKRRRNKHIETRFDRGRVL